MKDVVIWDPAVLEGGDVIGWMTEPDSSNIKPHEADGLVRWCITWAL